jgi:hypothetical protein
MAIETESRKAFAELIDLLREIDQRWVSEEWNLGSEGDVADAHRALMHMLEAGLVGWFEYDVRNPDFRRIVTPSRKLTGDNADAWYFDAPVDASHEYVVHGNMSGAIYFALTVEEGCADGSMADKLGGVINNTEMEVDSNGSFTLYLGGERREKNWLPLGPNANRVTSRHYFELAQCASGDHSMRPQLSIKCLNPGPAPEPKSDADIAQGIRRVCGFLRSRTLGMPAGSMADNPPPFVSTVPNEFPTPCLPGDMGLAAADAHYSMAPYLIGEDEALVITGRWPDCLFANICLWNRFMQIYDYTTRQVSLNRVQTQLEADGSFRMILSHTDPGLPNWLDTEGRAFGIVYWRFFLVNGEVETPRAEVVKLADLKQ